MNNTRKTEGLTDLAIAIPQDIENLKLPNPDLLAYYQELSERVIWLDFTIQADSLDAIKLILKYNKEDRDLPVEERKPIKLMIYCYGGDAAICETLINMIELSKTPVYTINVGVAFSAAAYIFIAGHKRYSLKRSSLMIHTGSGRVSGSYDQIQSWTKDYTTSIENIKDFIIEKTKITTKMYNKHKAEDWYIRSKEQLSLGICDAIIENIEEIL